MVVPEVVVSRFQVGIARSIHAPVTSVAEYYLSVLWSALRSVSFRFPVPFAIFQPIELSILSAGQFVVASIVVPRQSFLYFRESGFGNQGFEFLDRFRDFQSRFKPFGVTLLSMHLVKKAT